jgi:Asp-tRNA(Asn)/Glu-tRNA(Gln) amidotransferase A subunit family amidase
MNLDVTNINPFWGTPINPYNEKHIVGGSSGGSACMVAARLVPISLGYVCFYLTHPSADGGGSVRIPASICGVYGLKPTAYRIPTAGAFPACPTVGVLGPIAATASDLAISYLAMAGPDPDDKTGLSSYQPAVSIQGFYDVKDLKGVRIGIYEEYFTHADEVIVATCREFVEKCRMLGATIVDIELKWLEELRVAHLNIITSEMLACTGGFDRELLSYPTKFIPRF